MAIDHVPQAGVNANAPQVAPLDVSRSQGSLYSDIDIELLLEGFKTKNHSF